MSDKAEFYVLVEGIRCADRHELQQAAAHFRGAAEAESAMLYDLLEKLILAGADKGNLSSLMTCCQNLASFQLLAQTVDAASEATAGALPPSVLLQ